MRVATSLIAVIALLHLGACDDLPRDPDRTENRIRKRGTIRLGEVEGAAPDAAAAATLMELARRTGATIERIPGHGEELLDGLAEDEVDLVYGHFADDSPWGTHVHLGTPPGGPESPPKSMRLPRFAFRPGENGWIAEVEDAAP